MFDKVTAWQAHAVAVEVGTYREVGYPRLEAASYQLSLGGHFSEGVLADLALKPSKTAPSCRIRYHAVSAIDHVKFFKKCLDSAHDD